MADPKDKPFLERAEDYVSDSYDEDRKRIPPWDDVGRAKHDVEVGIMKGVYGGAKSLIGGAVDLLRLAGDPRALDDFVLHKAWPAAVFLAKEIYIAESGDPAKIHDQNERIIAFAKKVYGSFEKDWQEAGKKDGKRTELAAKWVSRGVFEVAALFTGAGEAKDAVDAARAAKAAEELAESERVLEGVKATCDAAKAKQAAASAEAVTQEMRAVEAPKAAEATTKEMPAVKASEAPTQEVRAVDPSEAPTQKVPAVKRIQRPRPKGELKKRKLYDDGHYEFTWKGQPKAEVKLKVKGDAVELDYANRGSQPKGSGPSMIADAVRASENPRPTKLIGPNILQKGPGSDKLIEDTVVAAAEELGAKETKVTRGVDGSGKHWVAVEITY